MHIKLPSGNVLVPDAEFLAEAGGVTYRTGLNWDKEGCPYVHVGGLKYRPLQEALAWIASRIQRRNPPRSVHSVRRSASATPTTPV
jgi:hypothetical protein